MPVRIGELLLKEKRLTPAQLQEALTYQKTNGGKLGYNLVKLIPAETAQKYQIVPLSRSGATLTIAMTDPTNVFAMDDIKFMTGYNVEPVVASETAVAEAIDRYFPATPVAAARVDKPVQKKEKKAAPPQQEANLNNAATLEMVTKALEETASIAEDDVELLETSAPVAAPSREPRATGAL